MGQKPKRKKHLNANNKTYKEEANFKYSLAKNFKSMYVPHAIFQQCGGTIYQCQTAN